MVGRTPYGYGEGMGSVKKQPGTVDEQLGSPILAFEEGWLVGLALGSILLVAVTRRPARRTK